MLSLWITIDRARKLLWFILEHGQRFAKCKSYQIDSTHQLRAQEVEIIAIGGVLRQPLRLVQQGQRGQGPGRVMVKTPGSGIRNGNQRARELASCAG